MLNNDCQHILALFPLSLLFVSLSLHVILLLNHLFRKQDSVITTLVNKFGSDMVGHEHISWHEYFMSVALLAAKRSKDPCTKVGACIVNGQNKIVATGYNGMPNGVQDDVIPWGKEGPFLETKYAYVVHAELNAILNSVLTDQTGCRLFVSLFPCNECAKAIIQSGIKHVIYLSDKHAEKDSTKASKRMFEMAGVHYEQFIGRLLI
jgi:dCMP deaminase